MKFKVLIAILIIGFVGLAAVSISKKSSTSSIKSLLVAEQPLHDFGTISMKDGNVSYTYIVQNTSTEPVTIKKLYTSCACTEASLAVDDKKVGPYSMEGHGGVKIPELDINIPAGEKGEVEVVYDPALHGSSGIGNIERSVFLDTSNGARTELVLKTTVKP